MIGQVLLHPRTQCTVVDAVGKAGRKLADLIFPVIDQCGGTNYQGFQFALLLFKKFHEGEGLHGFTKTHIVSQYSAPFDIL